MLLILGLALFPLGLVAALASIDAVRDGRSERVLLAQIDATRNAAGIDSMIARNMTALAIALARRDVAEGCAVLQAARLDGADLVLGPYGIYDPRGRLACAGAKGSNSSSSPNLAQGEARVWLDGSALHYGVRTSNGTALGHLGAASLLSFEPGDRSIDVSLEDGRRRLQLLDRYRTSGLQNPVTGSARLSRSSVFAVVTAGAAPTSAAEIASIVLPLIMWIAAALLGWLIVDRLLLRPIKRMQRAVLAYEPGETAMVLPALSTPATEIRDLGEAFARVTETVAEHEAEMEAAIARQARLVREVHHRVKNNLQVVASLLNLHARGARSADAADAYASILRRVDALAVVHRNHFAELEDDRGVALRTLLSELTANLRGTAPERAAGMAITLDLDTVHVNQDVAVSVAFFVTEVVEHAMLCTPDQPVGVTLTRSAEPTVARLKLSSASLREGADCENVDTRQFERITTGLSRQLRAVLERDGVAGVYAIDISVQPPS